GARVCRPLIAAPQVDGPPIPAAHAIGAETAAATGQAQVDGLEDELAVVQQDPRLLAAHREAHDVRIPYWVVSVGEAVARVAVLREGRGRWRGAGGRGGARPGGAGDRPPPRLVEAVDQEEGGRPERNRSGRRRSRHPLDRPDEAAAVIPSAQCGDVSTIDV